MPGLVIDPHQNQNVENRYGVAHIKGKLAVYDKKKLPAMRYKPAGWKLINENVELIRLEKPFLWRGKVDISWEITPATQGIDIEESEQNQGKLVRRLYIDAGREEGTRKKMEEEGIGSF